jgi:hypothetical protein
MKVFSMRVTEKDALEAQETENYTDFSKPLPPNCHFAHCVAAFWKIKFTHHR